MDISAEEANSALAAKHARKNALLFLRAVFVKVRLWFWPALGD
jgi:hypothetical protein